MKARLGMSPICRWNDDLSELSEDVSLREAVEAGYSAMESGRRFPKDMSAPRPILDCKTIPVAAAGSRGSRPRAT